LMAEPELVAECFTAMNSATDAEVTVKCRLGIDDQDVENTLPSFIESVADRLNGAMFGRAAYNTPWILTDVDKTWFGGEAFEPSRLDVAGRLIGYAKNRQEIDRSTKALIRHVMGLFAGQPGARLWRRTLSEGLGQKRLPSDILAEAVDVMQNLKRAA